MIAIAVYMFREYTHFINIYYIGCAFNLNNEIEPGGALRDVAKFEVLLNVKQKNNVTVKMPREKEGGRWARQVCGGCGVWLERRPPMTCKIRNFNYLLSDATQYWLIRDQRKSACLYEMFLAYMMEHNIRNMRVLPAPQMNMKSSKCIFYLQFMLTSHHN